MFPYDTTFRAGCHLFFAQSLQGAGPGPQARRCEAPPKRAKPGCPPPQAAGGLRPAAPPANGPGAPPPHRAQPGGPAAGGGGRPAPRIPPCKRSRSRPAPAGAFPYRRCHQCRGFSAAGTASAAVRAAVPMTRSPQCHTTCPSGCPCATGA